MAKFEFIFRELELNQIARDPNQPRKNFGTEGDENRLLVSIRDLGIQQPLAVSEDGEGKYIILDGHRRYICAQTLKLDKVPCRIYPKMNPGDFEHIRFEIQNNRRPWKPLERSDAIERIKEANGFRSNKEVAVFLHLSETLISNSLILRRQKMEYIGLMEKHEMPESYRVEFVRMKQKIRKIREFEVDEIIFNLFTRYQNGIIRNGKDFRELGRIFLRSTTNESEIHRYLCDPDMTVSELKQRTVQSGFSLIIEELINKIGTKRQEGVAFSSQEKLSLSHLKQLLAKVL